MAVRDRGVHKQSGRFDVRHDRHQVHRLMIRRLVDLQRIDETAMIISGICNASHDGDDNTLGANSPIDAIDGADETGRIARSQLQKVLVDAFLIVRVAVKENIRDLILLAALENRLFAVFLIELLVLGANAR